MFKLITVFDKWQAKTIFCCPWQAAGTALAVNLSMQQHNAPGFSRICNTRYHLAQKMSGNWSALYFWLNNAFCRFISRFVGTSRCLNLNCSCIDTWIRDPAGTFSLGKNAPHSTKKYAISQTMFSFVTLIVLGPSADHHHYEPRLQVNDICVSPSHKTLVSIW